MMSAGRSRIGITIAAVLAMQSASAQGTGEIRSRVLDQAGAPVADAQLELLPGSRRALTEEDGGFTFTQLKAGAYTLQVRRIGYQPQSVKIDVGAGATASPRIALVAIPRVLDSIRVFEHANGLRYTGAVLDERSAPIEGAIVMVPGKARELRTDANGRFAVEGFGAGTVIARVRKIGFAPQLHTLQMVNSKTDSIRMKRLAQSLSPVEVMAKSGFGKDTFVYKELDQRMRWKGERSYVVSREEFDRQGTTDLATAIRFSVTGGRYGGTLSHPMPDGCVIINGARALRDWPLTAFFADEVEAVEVYPPKSDPSGSLEVRGCDPKQQVYVIWTRANSKRFPPNP
ncbi:MAG TPA: carboxypeptidase-like regulatory domain-containing protein [Gemmatimonadaceae bacterium]